MKSKNIIKYLPVGMLSLVTVLSGWTLSAKDSSAEGEGGTSYMSTVTVNVPEACAISSNNTNVDENGDYVISRTITPGQWINDLSTYTTSVVCNDRNGYSVYAVGYGNDTEGNTSLVGTDPDNVIVTGTTTDTSVSNWMMKVTPVAGTFAPTAWPGTDDTAGANFHAVPSAQTKVITFVDGINVNTPSQFTVTYGVATTGVQAPDTYTGKVKYTLVHPNYTNADGTTESYPVTLGFSNAESLVIDGTTYTSASEMPSLTYGEHTISASTFPEGYEFDNWSVSGDITIADVSSSSTSINVTGSGTLTLNAKSKLWFQNATMADCGKTMYDNRGNDTYKNIAYTTAKIGSLCWMTRNLDLPGGTTLSQSDSNLNDSTTSYTLRASSTSGFSDTTTGWVYNSSSTYNDTSCGDNNPCYSYYSAVAATAGTNPSSGDASSDICPYGWRLPTRSEQSSVTSQSSTFSPVYSGYYNDGQFHGGGSNGFWWSAAASSASGQYVLLYINDSLTTSGVSKKYGYSVRCVKSS